MHVAEMCDRVVEPEMNELYAVGVKRLAAQRDSRRQLQRCL